MTDRRVGIVSVGQTTHEQRKTGTIEDMIFEAVEAAFRGCALEWEDVDVVADSGSDVLDGRSLGDCTLFEALGAHLKPSYRIEEDGAMSAYYANMLLQSGKYDTALVVGYGKGSNVSRSQYSNMMFEPFYTRPLGVDGATSAALQAQSYLDETGVDPAAAGEVVARNRASGADNPRVATDLAAMDADDVRGTEPVATPLRAGDQSPTTDGACALVLASEEIAEQTTESTAWIEGAAHSSDEYTLDRDLSRAPSCERAAATAYEQAGVDDPAAAVDLAEIGAETSFQELILYEALGLADRGEAPAALDGDVAVNPSGGALAADPIMATGLVRIGEAALQVMDQAPGRQVDGAATALAHGTTGINLQNNAVFVLEGSA